MHSGTYHTLRMIKVNKILCKTLKQTNNKVYMLTNVKILPTFNKKEIRPVIFFKTLYNTEYR